MDYPSPISLSPYALIHWSDFTCVSGSTMRMFESSLPLFPSVHACVDHSLVTIILCPLSPLIPTSFCEAIILPNFKNACKL